MVKIFFKPYFLRRYKKLPSDLRVEIREKIELFKENPSHPFLKTHKLSGRMEGLYSFSVNYQYRIVFKYREDGEVSLLTIGTHDIYKN
ncbi:type II toxin-antitoxin system mRNA interferase toxin, RelE/StbE family [Candidatus Peregrinibacteria bacterium]|nr:type II toxin-antitoxin system mRNA interferase toxin, RelE/StbE family [Candidatus Peregrinibacteria bacterium]